MYIYWQQSYINQVLFYQKKDKNDSHVNKVCVIDIVSKAARSEPQNLLKMN